METPEITIKFDKQQIINIFRQLKPAERKSIFEEFEEDIYDYFFDDERIKKMTIEEYNSKLAESELAYKNGKFLTQNEFEQEIETWK